MQTYLALYGQLIVSAHTLVLHLLGFLQDQSYPWFAKVGGWGLLGKQVPGSVLKPRLWVFQELGSQHQ